MNALFEMGQELVNSSSFVVRLACHRNRWEQAALKRKQSLVGLGRVYWDASLDESRLIAAAAHATAGAVFLAKK